MPSWLNGKNTILVLSLMPAVTIIFGQQIIMQELYWVGMEMTSQRILHTVQ